MEFDLTKLNHKTEQIKIYSVLDNRKETEISNSYRAHASPLVITLPTTLTQELSYVVGAFLGDGSIKKPLKRKKGGYYYSLDFTGGLKSVTLIRNKINKIFGYSPTINKVKRRENSWFFNINSVVIHRFFTKIIGFVPGKKSGNMPWFDSVCANKELFKYFLAGLIDTDGYVSTKYACIIQKDKNFLENVKNKSKELLDIEFQGPRVNRRINNEIVGWWILLNKKELEKIRELPLEIKKINEPGGI